MKSILFVCLGNICRSPIAEGCAKRLASQKELDIEISSAGTGSWHIGESPCENSIKVCKMHDIDISMYIASQFTKSDISSYDLVVALDHNNYNDLKNMGVTNLVKLGYYGYYSQDIPDPYFFDGFSGFEEVYKMINECVENLFNEII
jgi:protein-tyrosine phosphatase